MMIKKFEIHRTREEDIDKLIKDNADDISTWNIGDEVYCIDNSEHEEILNIGQKYVINDIDNSGGNLHSLIYLFDVKHNIFSKRFTKNPNHPLLAQKRFDL